MRKVSRRRVAAILGTTAAAAMLLAACGSSSSSTQTSNSAKKVSGGTAYFAEGAGASPNYIFPLTSGAYFSVDNLAQFQVLMYRPLYWFGNGSKAEIDYQLSVANPPVFSNGNKTVTITLKHYMWSDGEPVTSRDVIFWMNLLKANETDWGAYVPGGFPDNVVSYSAPNADTVVFHLNKSYNPTWFTYNELSQITPLPIAWDRTSLSQPVPSPTAKNLPDTTKSGAQDVYKFLNGQATDTATYASSPIWSVVDGPWKLQSFTTTGQAVFVPNPKYTGPVKPTLAKFVELPFTSDTAEFNELRTGSGAITLGFIPFSDISQIPYIKSLGYNVVKTGYLGFNYWVENYNNPTYGGLFKQLYFRQALQHLVNQPEWITAFLKGYGEPSYSPVPVYPPNPFADAESRSNPYPASTSAAEHLLESHGWKMVNGVMTCESPGSGSTSCGPGTTKGETLSLNLQYASGTPSLTQEMEAFASAAKTAGITINLSSATFNTVIGNASSCNPSQPSTCAWEMENWGGGWEYSPDNYPTGGELFLTGSGSNFGSYSSLVANQLINSTHTASNAQAALDAYQNYMVKQLPVIYQPLALTASAFSSKLHGVTFNPYLNLDPEAWYFVK